MPVRSISFGTMVLLIGVLCLGQTPPSSRPSTQPASAGPSPSPALTPQQVVRIQLTALRRNDDPAPDSGIAKVFEFASPENQAQTGPLPKFIKMVKTAEYLPMVNHRRSMLAPLTGDDKESRQLVRIIAGDGSEAFFMFILHKQSDGKYKGCWMTEGVVRVRPENAAPAQPNPDAPGAA